MWIRWPQANQNDAPLRNHPDSCPAAPQNFPWKPLRTCPKYTARALAEKAEHSAVHKVSKFFLDATPD